MGGGEGDPGGTLQAMLYLVSSPSQSFFFSSNTLPHPCLLHLISPNMVLKTHLNGLPLRRPLPFVGSTESLEPLRDASTQPFSSSMW